MGSTRSWFFLPLSSLESRVPSRHKDKNKVQVNPEEATRYSVALKIMGGHFDL